MYYDKRIRYLSYYESGIKLQNAGYVKFQVRDSLCQMIIYVKGPRLMGSGEARVYLLSEKPEKKGEDSFYHEGRKNNLNKHLLGTLAVRNGQGYCAVRMHAENMADSGVWYDEICGIRIEMHEYQYLESQWTVVNLMPGQKNRRGSADNKAAGRGNNTDSSSTGGRQSGADAAAAGRGQRKTGEPADDGRVEVNLIVTPVSENLRVEKVVKEKPVIDIEEMERFEIEEDFMAVDEGTEIAEEITVDAAGNNADTAGGKEELPAEEKTENMTGQPSGEEDSMQEMLEREILREETQRTLDEEILKGMEEGEREETAEIPEEIRSSERELRTDKWEQLRKTYPVVHPIREEEEYLKIAPKDFVIFTEKYQELVHNSFLMHGYYNYKHLILGRKEKDNRTVYYLGVPGTFHEREKTVAVMFGFEAFDGKREPAENGDFGYYLRRVEI